MDYALRDRFRRLPIQWQILASSFATALPLLVLLMAVVVYLGWSSAEEQKADLQYSASSIVAGLESRLQKYVAIAQALAASPSLLDQELTSFRREADRVRSVSAPEIGVVVVDEYGAQLMNTAFPQGTALPYRSALGLSEQKQVLANGTVYIGGIRLGPALQVPVFTVEVPVRISPSTQRVLVIVIRAATLVDLISPEKVPPDRFIGIADRRGIYVARFPGNQRYLGGETAPGWRATLGREGIFTMRSIEGVPITSANAVSPTSGWTVGVAISQTAINSQAWRSIRWSFFLASGLCLGTALLSIAIAKQIGRPIVELAKNASALVANPALANVRGPEEVMQLQEALHRAAAERIRYESQLELLMKEIAHRGKNQLAVVQAIARQAAPKDYPAFLASFNERIASLSSAQDLLMKTDYRGASIEQVVRDQIGHFGELLGERVALHGSELILNLQAVQAIAMAVHELATNAVKYGSLSTPTGKVELTWAVADGRLRLRWKETGGPKINPSIHRHVGFGSLVLSRMIEMALGGVVQQSFLSEGLEWVFECHANDAVQKKGLDRHAGMISSRAS